MNSRKILSLILAGVILASSFIGCSENTVSDESDAPVSSDSSSETVPIEETEDTYVYDSLEDQDFDGYEFRIIPAHSNHQYAIREEYTGEPLNDAIYQSNLAVMDRFNVKIVDVPGSGDEQTRSMVAQAVQADDDAFDITLGHDNQTAYLGTGGYLHDLYEIPQFDFDQPWWPKNARIAMTLEGKMYTASNYLSYAGLAMTRVMFVNKDLMEKNNLEVPYDVVREGKWTYDTFYTYLEGYAEDLNGDGQMPADTDRFAFAAGFNSWYCLQEAADVNVYRHDDDGMLYIDMNQEKIAEFIEKSNKITNPNFYVRGDNMGADVFNSNRAMFATTDLNDAYDSYRHTEITYGILPCPKLNELQEEYINCCTDKLWGIPIHIGGEQLEIVGTICEALSCSNFNIVIPAYFDVTMKSRIADTPDDSEMLQLIRDTRTVAFAYTFLQPLHSIHSGSRNENVGSLVAKYESKIEKSLKIFKNNLPN